MNKTSKMLLVTVGLVILLFALGILASQQKENGQKDMAVRNMDIVSQAPVPANAEEATTTKAVSEVTGTKMETVTATPDIFVEEDVNVEVRRKMETLRVNPVKEEKTTKGKGSERVERIVLPVASFKRPMPASTPRPAPAPALSLEEKSQRIPEITEDGVEWVLPKPKKVTKSNEFIVQRLDDRLAPIGRLLKCQTVTTVDSSLAQTPIVGMVVQDLWWEGQLIVPAGTEVHGVATIDTIRDRVVTGQTWNLVFQQGIGSMPNGAVLTIGGMALDWADGTGEGQTWGISDGSFGLKGQILRATDYEAVKLGIGGFLSSFSAALQTRRVDPLTGKDVIESTPRNASLSGISRVAEEYARRILQEIEKNGAYVRVPSGKPFYLYVSEPIVLSKAKVGGGTYLATFVGQMGAQPGSASAASLEEQLRQTSAQVASQLDALYQGFERLSAEQAEIEAEEPAPQRSNKNTRKYEP